MAAKRTRVVGRLRWLRLSTGERITTCARYWLVPYGRERVWWLYMREHAGDLRRTSWRLVYRSHKLAAALAAASVCQRATTQFGDDTSTAPRRRRVDAELVAALDSGELQPERFAEQVAPTMRLWGVA
jgi:hypothetical protein